MDGFHLKKGEEKMFNKRLLKTFKAEMKNVYGLVLIQWLVLVSIKGHLSIRKQAYL